MKIEDGIIIEGKQIANIFLGMNYGEMLDIIGEEFSEKQLEQCKIIEIENAKFWFDKENNLYQISVFGDFNGKFKDIIGINSTLSEVQEKIGEYEEEFDIYILKKYKGISFELQDVEDWEELTAPIEFISIFSE